MSPYKIDIQYMISTNRSTFINIGVLVLVSWSVKLLLVPAYYSTDFAVHQNWLRITHSQPISNWYYDTQSKWTLDYPPLFAYFEYLLSIIANFIDTSIVSTINQLPLTIFFQRVSVAVTDLLYLWALFKVQDNNYTINTRLVILYLWLPFIILDNIHFQYNLMMQAILVLSVGYMNKHNYLKAAFCFSLLLNFKHIYLYCAPAFFVYLLKYYVFDIKPIQPYHAQVNSQNQSGLKINSDQHPNITQNQQNMLIRFAKVGVVTIIPFFISFGPFLLAGGVQGIKQIFNRLFPFSRGLVHEYWAPNFWALYYFADKVLVLLGIKGHDIYQMPADTKMGSVNFLKVLPDVSPNITIFIILACLAPIIVTFFLTKRNVRFVDLVSICGLLFFMFGFHVHEKAIVPYISLLFMFAPDVIFLNAASFVSIVNLFPLLILPGEKMFSIVCCLLWLAIWDFLDHRKKQSLVEAQQRLISNFSLDNAKKVSLIFIQYFIQISGFLLTIFHLIIHPLIKRPNIEFLPFMMNSVWAAIFNIVWAGYLYYKFIHDHIHHLHLWPHH